MTVIMAAGLLALALCLAMLGGALTGTWIAGKHLGRELAALMGAFYGPAAAVPAVALGIALLAWLR